MLPFGFEAQPPLLKWQAAQEEKRKETILEMHFGTPELFLRLTTFQSASSALPEVNTAISTSLQTLLWQAGLHAMKQQWLDSFPKHKTSCMHKARTLTCNQIFKIWKDWGTLDCINVCTYLSAKISLCTDLRLGMNSVRMISFFNYTCYTIRCSQEWTDKHLTLVKPNVPYRQKQRGSNEFTGTGFCDYKARVGSDSHRSCY